MFKRVKVDWMGFSACEKCLFLRNCPKLWQAYSCCQWTISPPITLPFLPSLYPLPSLSSQFFTFFPLLSVFVSTLHPPLSSPMKDHPAPPPLIPSASRALHSSIQLFWASSDNPHTYSPPSPQECGQKGKHWLQDVKRMQWQETVTYVSVAILRVCLTLTGLKFSVDVDGAYQNTQHVLFLTKPAKQQPLSQNTVVKHTVWVTPVSSTLL